MPLFNGMSATRLKRDFPRVSVTHDPLLDSPGHQGNGDRMDDVMGLRASRRHLALAALVTAALVVTLA